MTIEEKISCEQKADEQAVLALYHFQTELVENVEKNWLPSQVKMLKALIASTITRQEYGEAYMAFEESNDKNTVNSREK